MQEIVIRRTDILEALKEGKTIVVENDNGDYAYYTMNMVFIGQLPRDYVIYFDSYDYDDFDDDDEVIDFLKDCCLRIKEVKIKII